MKYIKSAFYFRFFVMIVSGKQEKKESKITSIVEKNQ